MGQFVIMLLFECPDLFHLIQVCMLVALGAHISAPAIVLNRRQPRCIMLLEIRLVLVFDHLVDGHERSRPIDGCPCRRCDLAAYEEQRVLSMQRRSER